ncbi:MAG: hypothetical protein BMS9Abin20_1070 [Acidimicrobiia bacterium]|nr:MAG: hypothetical protein BMS9Abin20_1070 [Acidimicrobiia bacterium]
MTDELSGSWEVASISDGSGTLSAPLAGTSLTATITEDRIGGIAGCNQYGGDISVNGSAVSFGPLVSTLMACLGPPGVMDQESTYLGLLQTVDAWEMTDKGIDLLSLGETVIQLVRTDQNLAGTEWTVIAVNDQNGGVLSTLGDTVPMLVFQDESAVSGTTGCNSFSGTYSAEEGSIDIRSLSVTEMFCSSPDGLMDQEARVLTALERSTAYRVEDQTLDLFDDDGSRLLTAQR